MVNKALILAVLAACCLAGEVVVELPDPMIPGVQMAGSIRITDPPVDVTAIDLPSVPGLEWRMSGRNTSNTLNINGARSTVYTVGLAVRGSQKGTINLPAITVQLSDGTTMHSAPSRARVDDGDARLTGEAFTEIAFDPVRIVPGQQTNLVYRLYLRHGEANSLGVGPPEGMIALGERSITNGQTVDAQGRAWSFTTVTWPVTHSKPGTYTVGGQQDYQVVVGEGFFNQRAVRRQIAVPAASLTVLEMPAAGRPKDFSGLIGPLSATMAFDRQRVAASEGCLLSLTVTSRQSDLVKRPALAVAGLQFYPKDDRTEAGSRILTWDVVPVAPGVITVPAVSFAFFDPGSASYRTAETDSLTLTVIPGRNRDLGLVGQNTTSATATPTREEPPPIVLPEPQHGHAAIRPTPWIAPAAMLGGVFLAAGWSLVARLRGARSGPHRGRALRMAGRDVTALDAALHALATAPLTPEQRTALATLQKALDHHRFGGEPLAELSTLVRLLEDVA